MTASWHVGAKLLISRISEVQQRYVCVCVSKSNVLKHTHNVVDNHVCANYKIQHRFVQSSGPIGICRNTVPSCPAGLWRAHSSQRGSASAWWPPPQPACGGWTESAVVWAAVGAVGLAGRCGHTLGFQTGPDSRKNYVGQGLGHGRILCWCPRKGWAHCFEHSPPH